MLYTDEEIRKRIKRKNIISGIITTIVYFIVIPLLVYNISLIVQSILNPKETPSFLGIKTYVIVSGSMEPTIHIGDVVVAKNVKDNELQVGDIICFRHGQTVITHRISEVIEENNEIEYKTKGDNNNVEDSSKVTQKSIEGKVVKIIPYIGNISLILQQRIVIIGIIGLFYIYMLFQNAIKRKKTERNRKRIRYEHKKIGEE